MKPKTNRIVTGLGLLVLIACISTIWAAATKTSFTGTESHVAWLEQPPPKITPSGHTIIRQWVHLWYDDADDDRLDGYDTVVIRAMFDPNGNLIQASGTFTVREKLDAIPIEDLPDLESSPFGLEDIIQGDVLWEGTWTLPARNGKGVFAVAQSPEGLSAFYSFSPAGGSFTGYILDPHGE
jgi:hypothetical protein